MKDRITEQAEKVLPFLVSVQHPPFPVAHRPGPTAGDANGGQVGKIHSNSVSD